MLHTAIAADLVAQEARVAREAHGRRVAALDVIGTDVICTLENTAVGTALLRLDGARYDAEPFGVTIIDADGSVAPAHRWPSTLATGEHPTLKRTFCCVRGCAEYHSYPGHTADPWDLHRPQLRLVNLLDHLLTRAGK